MNRDEAYAEAQRLNVPGRSKMTADELRAAIAGRDADALARSLHPDVDQAQAEAASAPTTDPHASPARGTFLQRLRLQRSHEAGNLAAVTPAMENARRADIYRQQRHGAALTPRQQRRLRKNASPPHPPGGG